MPKAHGFTVSLVAEDGQHFQEYGHQNLSGSNTRGNTISTKVQAKDGQKFQVKITLEQPFPYNPIRSHAPTAPEGQATRPDSSLGRYNLRSSLPGTNQDRTSGVEQGQDRALVQRTVNIPGKKLPFEFVAWVFVDGNRVPECSQILYLERKGEPHMLKGRYTARHKGQPGGTHQDLTVQDWVFTPVGIDVLLSKMDIAAADPQPPANAIEEQLDEVIQGLAGVNKVKRNKPGQIEVRITRIVGLGHNPRTNWARSEKESQRGDAVADADTTHTISVSNAQHKMRVRTCAWRAYDETEEYYAKFIFQYMGIEKLVNLGLCTADGKAMKPQLRSNASPHSSLFTSANSQPISLKRERQADDFNSDSKPESLPRDSADEESEETSSGDDSDRPRKRHEATFITNKSHDVSFTPYTAAKDAGLCGMQLMTRAEQQGGGPGDQGTGLVESVEDKKDDHVAGSDMALPSVEAHDSGEDKIE